MNILRKIRDWFDASRRQAIYTAAATIAPILVYLGVITEGQTEAVLVITSATLQSFAAVLAIVNWTPRFAGEWFISGGRVAIYTLAAACAPAAVALGWFTEETSVNVLTWVSLSLTALQALVSVIFITPDYVQAVRRAKQLPNE